VKPSLYAKIKKLADDPSTDEMTRKIARAQLDSVVNDPPPGIHPGLRQTPEYQAWAKWMRENHVQRRR
jgi:hypothetical protein